MKRLVFVLLFVLLMLAGAVTSASASSLSDATKLCNNGNMDECMRVGFFYETGQGVAEDAVKASHFYQKACDGGSAAGCGQIGFRYWHGFGVERDIIKAQNFFRDACARDIALWCTSLGVILVGGHDGVEVDHKMAAKFYKRACTLEASLGCLFLGRFYLEGTGVEKSKIEAGKYLLRACETETLSSCEEYKRLDDQ